MQVQLTDVDGRITKVILQGRLDIDNTALIESRLARVTTIDRALVIIDLSQVDFMSSIGLGVLVRISNAVKNRKGKMVLLAPQPIVMLVLEKTRIPAIIPIATDMEAALAELESL